MKNTIETHSSMVKFHEVTLEEKDSLAEWLSTDVWDNFATPKVSNEMALKWVEQGRFHGDDKKTFWICVNEHNRIGLLQLYDLLDPTAMFDLRLNTHYRRMGIGSQALRWLTDYVFETFSGVNRIAANTRQDNIGMRKALLSCGYVKEAHYRGGSKAGDNPADWVDVVAYAALRYDWANNCVSPVHWDDERSLNKR